MQRNSGQRRGEHFEPSCLCSGVFFRDQKACKNNSFENHLYTTEKELPNTTGRTSAKGQGPDIRRHGYNESLTILDRVLISSRSRSRIQWAGFSHGGHGPKCQKMHGHPKSQVFSCGHMDPAHPQISVQVHETQVSG